MRILVIAARIVGHRCLQAVLAAGAEVCGLLHLDDARADSTVAHAGFGDLIRGYRLNAQAFSTLKGAEGARHLQFAKDARPDLGIVVGVSELVPEAMLALPRMGFIGMHPTLLPQGRGRAPIPWALINGLDQTGVTLFYADGSADTGDILDQAPVPIFDADTAATLGARTDEMACRLFVKNLPRLAAGTAPRIVQDEARASVWPRRRPEDGAIDWSKNSRALHNWVRALTHPYPGAFTTCCGRKLFIWSAAPATTARRGWPGEIVAREGGAAIVSTGAGALALQRVQWEGEAETSAAWAGLIPGMKLGATASERILEGAVAR